MMRTLAVELNAGGGCLAGTARLNCTPISCFIWCVKISGGYTLYLNEYAMLSAPSVN